MESLSCTSETQYYKSTKLQFYKKEKKEMTVEKLSTGKRISVQDTQSVALGYSSLSKVTGHPLYLG